MARTRKTQTPEVTIPTVTDEQYKDLLATRLAAMHGHAEGTVDDATKNLARAAVRKARKVRKVEEENGVLPAYREHLQAEAEKAELAKQARSQQRKARRTKPEPQPEPVTETQPEPVNEVESEDAA